MAQVFRKTTLLLLLALTLSACNLLKLVYEYGDVVVLYQLDRHLDLDDPQEDWAEARLDQFLRWHRQEELPRYTRGLRQIAEQLKGPVTAEQVTGFHQEFESWQKSSGARIIEELTPLFAELRANQIERFKEKLQEGNEEIRERLKLPLQERRKKLCKIYEESLEDWIGEFRKDQYQRLQSFCKSLPLFEKERLEYRERTQTEFFQSLKGNQPEPIRETLRALWVEDRDQEDPYKLLVAQTKELAHPFFAELFNGLDEQQRVHLRERLIDFAKDFEELFSAK